MGKNMIMMEFRAQNGFGGMNVGYAKGTMSNATCNVSVEQIDS
jgi:hypothetical protein